MKENYALSQLIDFVKIQRKILRSEERGFFLFIDFSPPSIYIFSLIFSAVLPHPAMRFIQHLWKQEQPEKNPH